MPRVIGTNNKMKTMWQDPSDLEDKEVLILDPVAGKIMPGTGFAFANSDGSSIIEGLASSTTPQVVTPDDADGAGINVILPATISVSVGANVNGVDDWVTLPALASVPIGHVVTIISNAAGHEVRTPATSAEEINSEDCDGTKEYAIAAGGQIHRFTKIDNTIGWMGQGFTAIGAVVAAIVPD